MTKQWTMIFYRKQYVVRLARWGLVLLVLIAPLAGAMTKHALLVGVSQYPNLPPDKRLNGPANDVVLVRDILQQYGFSPQDIKVLADGVEGADGEPTKSAIMHALDELKDPEKVSPGDFIYIHFSGHGSQQPVASDGEHSNEPDGLDEIFLPLDIKRWNGDIEAVELAISDDEIHDSFTQIRQQGAFIWAVFDNCHSGSIVRGMQMDDVRDRKLSPADLGIPVEAIAKARAVSGTRSRGGGVAEESPLAEFAGISGKITKGGLVAFYAAQSSETTPEEMLPKSPLLDPNDPERKRRNPDRVPRGLFTYTLMQTVSANPGITYQQAMDHVLQTYASWNRNNPMPYAEGESSLDAPVFGTVAQKGIRQWRISTAEGAYRIKAGSLHQLSADTVLAVVPSAVAADDEILGYVSITATELTQSKAVPVTYDGKAPLPTSALPDGAFARLVEPNFSFQVQVAMPPAPSDARDLSAYAKAIKVRDLLGSDKQTGLAIDWVHPRDEADIRLLVKDQQLWFMPPGGELISTGPEKTHSIGLSGTDTDIYDKVVMNLRSMAKVINLLKLANGLVAGQAAINVDVTVSSAKLNAPAPGSLTAGIIPGDVECRNLRYAAPRRVSTGKISKFGECDKLRFEIRNTGKTAIDVTVLFIDSSYGIHPVAISSGGNRIEASGTSWASGTVRTAETVGLERVIVIGTKAARHRQPEDFSFLAQASLPKTRNVRGEGSGFRQVLERAGFRGGTSRGFEDNQPAGVNQASMQVFSWRTAAKSNQ